MKRGKGESVERRRKDKQKEERKTVKEAFVRKFFLASRNSSGEQ